MALTSQIAAGAVLLLVLVLWRILTTVSRAQQMARSRITALRQALAQADNPMDGWTRGLGFVVALHTPGAARFEFRHLHRDQILRWEDARLAGAPVTLHANRFLILEGNIAIHETLKVRIPAGHGPALPVHEPSGSGLWEFLRDLPGVLSGRLFATGDELDELLYAVTDGRGCPGCPAHRADANASPPADGRGTACR